MTGSGPRPHRHRVLSWMLALVVLFLISEAAAAGEQAIALDKPRLAQAPEPLCFCWNDGRKMAKWTGIDRLLRVKTLPFSTSIPWLFMPGDLPHIPFPAKIRIQVMEPIDLHEMFGEEPDWDQAYDYVTSTMQVGLSNLAARTVIPVLG